MPEHPESPTATTQLSRLDGIRKDVNALHDALDDLAEQIQDLHEDDYSLPDTLNMPHEDATDLNHAMDQARRALRSVARIAATYATRLTDAPAPGITDDCSKRAHLRPIRTTG